MILTILIVITANKQQVSLQTKVLGRQITLKIDLYQNYFDNYSFLSSRPELG